MWTWTPQCLLLLRLFSDRTQRGTAESGSIVLYMSPKGLVPSFEFFTKVKVSDSEVKIQLLTRAGDWK